jgi:thiopurine S-methyltransferase
MKAIKQLEQKDWQEKWLTEDTPWIGDPPNKPLYDRYQKLLELGLSPHDPVFVPLCGNSPAVRFLYDRGHHVTAVEFVPEAMGRLQQEQFPTTNFVPHKMPDKELTSFTAERLNLVLGDFFMFNPDRQYSLIYDRGALVALSPDRWKEYAPKILSFLKPNGFYLLRAAEFDQSNFIAPPFSLPDTEAKALFSDLELIEVEEQINTEPPERFKVAGVSQIRYITYLFRLNVII